MEKIKICYILPAMARGGAERFSLDLISNLDNSLFSISVILFKDKGSFYQELKNLNVHIYTLRKGTLLGLMNFYRLFTILKKIKPHIVHTQLGGDIRGRLAAFWAGVKIIISTEQNLNKSEKLYQRIAKIMTAPLADEAVAISLAVANDMQSRYYLPDSKCKLIIPNGLNLKKFTYREDKIDTANLKVGAIGRLHPQKGFDLMIKAWQIISPDKAQLTIAGDGPEKNNLENQITEAGLTNSVKLLGDVSDVNSFYNNLDLLIIPSRWEGLGIVALEAGARGIPIIASDADGLQEILSPERAWIFKAGDINDLVQTLKQTLAEMSDDSTIKKQRNLRQYIEDNFDIIKVAQSYTQLYLKLYQQKYENTSSK